MTITAGKWIEDITMGSQVVKYDRKKQFIPKACLASSTLALTNHTPRGIAPSMMWIKKDYLLDGGIIPIEWPDIVSCVGYEEATIHQYEG